MYSDQIKFDHLSIRTIPIHFYSGDDDSRA